eukprot:m.105972 g.105972  ORF g.105972 m.105972 type:complete len:187 (+) comp15805_c1_seq3:56-616(+)
MDQNGVDVDDWEQPAVGDRPPVYYPGHGQPPHQDEDFWQLALTFVREVNWTEPWLLALISFHLTVLCLILLFRGSEQLQAVVFVTIGIIALSAEKINEWAATNWRSFAGQQYFDSAGVFISVVLSVPIILNGLLIVMLWLKGAATMLVKVKRAQLRQRSKEAKNTTAATAAATPAAPASTSSKKDN